MGRGASSAAPAMATDREGPRGQFLETSTGRSKEAALASIETWPALQGGPVDCSKHRKCSAILTFR